MSSLVKFVEEQLVEAKNHPSFSSGDTITVYYEIREGDKKRTQFFKGVVSVSYTHLTLPTTPYV